MKVTIIGAGSAFGSRLSVDVLSREPIGDATIALCDLDEGRLNTVADYVESVIAHNKLKARVERHTDRRQALPGSDFVVISIAVGGSSYFGELYETELAIGKKHGIHQLVGDTVGPAGIIRGLRTAPVMIDICRDVSALAPGAMILNHTNPMCILTWALNHVYDGDFVGLCHGIPVNILWLGEFLGIPKEEIGYWCAGINHMSWYLTLAHRGEDLYPRLREATRNPTDEQKASRAWEKCRLRLEMIEHFGYFVTESDHHIIEYIPYHREEAARRYEAHEVERAANKQKRVDWFEDMGLKAKDAGSVKLIRSHEYSTGIMEAVVTGEPYRFTTNTLNTSLIPNLPEGCCVEVPAMADGQGVHPCHVGALPPQCAALCRTNVNCQELAVRAILDRSREAAYHAFLMDPVTSSTLSLDRIRPFFDEMWEAEGDLLDYYDR